VELCSDLNVNANKKTRYDRLDVAQKVVNIKSILKKTNNKSEAARVSGVPRSTARYWLDREDKTGLSPEVELFFESPPGMAFLHQLFIAAQFTITQLSPCGVDILAKFLHLSQLDKFVASSHGTLHKQSMQMESAINQFGEQEGKKLALKMPKKKITLCEDETFHPEICLVAMEPVSNFILLEAYSERRDGDSWSAAIKEALTDLPVDVIQATSDGGTGLIKHVEQSLQAHHSPDLFHVQQDLTRATSAPINAKVKQAEKTYETSKKVLEKLLKKQEKEDNIRENPDLCSDLDRDVILEEMAAEAALIRLNELKKNQEDIKESKKALGTVYHPYDLETGAPQTAEVVGEKMEAHYATIQTIADNADLSDNSMRRLEKAHRVFKGMIHTIAFFWSFVAQHIATIGLTPEMESIMRDILIPAFYLQVASKKAKKAKERHRLAKLSKELLARLELIAGWGILTDSIKDQMRTIAKDCANVFQRSSSCVEGRNGYLSLRHHGSHQLSKRKLKALTVIHNYFIQRSDQTTAAERFFESKPRNLFEFLLDQLDVSARPAKSRRVNLMAA
jgi:hypothetical protein